MIGRDTENWIGLAVLKRRMEDGREEISRTKKGIENTTITCRKKGREMGRSLEWSHTLPIFVSVFAICFRCFHSISVMTSAFARPLHLEKWLLSRSPFFSVQLRRSFVPWYLWPCVSGCRKQSQQSKKRKVASKGRGTASQLSSRSLTPASFLPSSGVYMYVCVASL